MAVRNPLGPADDGHQVIAAALGPALGGHAFAGHVFRRPELLHEALTHRSAAHGREQRNRDSAGRPQRGPRPRSASHASNERLEFIGDRVLGLVVAEWLIERFPTEQEGELARRHAHLVARPLLAEVGERLGLADKLAVAPNEARAGVSLLPTVLADAMEAVIGAVYLDGGLEPARALVRQAWESAMAAQILPPTDPKTALQEWLGARGLPLPVYVVASQEGPPHAPTFVVTVAAGGHQGSGSAGSKQAAERAAAAALLGLLAP
jgi:ribonuclease-3